MQPLGGQIEDIDTEKTTFLWQRIEVTMYKHKDGFTLAIKIYCIFHPT